MFMAMNTTAGQTIARTQLMLGTQRADTYAVYRRAGRPSEASPIELPLPGTPGRGVGRGGEELTPNEMTTGTLVALIVIVPPTFSWPPLPNPLPRVQGRGSKTSVPVRRDCDDTASE